jgi:hypothetical protein
MLIQKWTVPQHLSVQLRDVNRSFVRSFVDKVPTTQTLEQTHAGIHCLLFTWFYFYMSIMIRTKTFQLLFQSTLS